jgi:hypothetical protein
MTVQSAADFLQHGQLHDMMRNGSGMTAAKITVDGEVAPLHHIAGDPGKGLAIDLPGCRAHSFASDSVTLLTRHPSPE